MDLVLDDKKKLLSMIMENSYVLKCVYQSRNAYYNFNG